MKLYRWEPKGFGQHSVFVMAESLQEATEKANNAVKINSQNDRYSFDYWGTDYYELKITSCDEVVFHSND